MPVMDGYEATKVIRGLEDRKLAEIPILAMTANAFNEDVEAAKNAGMQAHIAKPIDIAVLMKTLTDVLRAGEDKSADENIGSDENNKEDENISADENKNEDENINKGEDNKEDKR